MNARRPTTFSQLPVGATFRFTSDPLRETCRKVDGRTYENGRGERVWPGWSLGAAGFGPMLVREVRAYALAMGES